MNDYATLARIEDHLRRQADASERIADALERAHPAKYNPGGLVRPQWDIASVPNRVELEPVPNQPGVFREVKHAAWDDCERPACGERLFGTDYTCTERRGHGPLHRDGPRKHEWQARTKWDPPGPVAKCILSEPHQGPHMFVQDTDAPGTIVHGVTTSFCDCDDDATIEAENGATD